jgi:NDP-sugar pyrophosphorylase family protein
MALSLSSIPALVLAGGLGTRLRPAVGDMPKVLAPIHGRPYMHYLLEPLAAAGVCRVVLCTGYRADLVEATMGSTFAGMELRYSRETTPLGTAGALRAALAHADGPVLLALNGDSFCRVDFPLFLHEHEQSGAAISIVLTHVDDAGRYGQVQLDDEGAITAFREKEADAGPGWINAGIYLMRRDVLGALPEATNISLEREVFPRWVGRGLHGYCGGDDFLDIGTPESYAQAALFFTRPCG